MNRRAWIEDCLARVPMFAGLSKPQLASIGCAATRLDEPAGKLLNEDGRLIIVLVGEVEVRVGNRIATRCGSGDCIANGLLTDDRRHPVTVLTKTPVVLEVIELRQVENLLSHFPGLADQIRD